MRAPGQHSMLPDWSDMRKLFSSRAKEKTNKWSATGPSCRQRIVGECRPWFDKNKTVQRNGAYLT